MQRVEAAGWRDAVQSAIQQGHRTFVTLIGLDDGGLQVLLRLRDDGGQDLVLGVDAADGVPTLIEVLPQAAWYEREVAEMFGVTFIGHDTQPLLLAAGTEPPMRKDRWLPARQDTPWPGEKEPGGAVPRRRQLPPGVRP